MNQKRLSKQSPLVDCSNFWQLWLLHEEYLYKRCLSWMSGNINDAQDAIAQARLKAWEKFPKYESQIQDPKAWLIRLTHNLCIDIYRQKNRQVLSLDEVGDFVNNSLNSIESVSDLPDRELENNELGILIKQAINSLPDTLRVPFILRFIHDLSYQEISQKLSIKIDSLYKIIQKSRKILQRRLSGYLDAINIIEFSQYGSNLERVELIAEVKNSSVYRPIESISYSITALCPEKLMFAECG
ncbi:MAG: RNA polymerase sigma factor [Spirulina sp. SIO3F2]|nr:RNA polymerase sigma factor [Spirulina sp. SIO3F2]